MTRIDRTTRWRSRSPPSRRRNRPEDPFALYIVDCEGPPLVHVSRTRRTEIVIFGRQQKLLTPIVLDGGEILVNAGDNDEKVELSKIVAVAGRRLRRQGHELAGAGRRGPPGRQPGRHVSRRSSALLEKANKQRNLPGQLVVDAVPAASPAYLEAIMGRDLHAKRDDAVGRASGEPTRPRWRFLGLFNRDHDTNPTPASPSASTPTMARRPSTGAETSDAELPALPGARPRPSPRADRRPRATAPAVKKDDAVQQTSASGAAVGVAFDSDPHPHPSPLPRLLAEERRRLIRQTPPGAGFPPLPGRRPSFHVPPPERIGTTGESRPDRRKSFSQQGNHRPNSPQDRSCMVKLPLAPPKVARREVRILVLTVRSATQGGERHPLAWSRD